MPDQPKLTLYTYFRSSAATRVRTLLSAQGTPYEPVYIHLVKGEQKSAEYTSINPSAAVPTLKVQDESGEWYLTQSAAIMEYLDATFGAASKCGSLMPKDEKGKAIVRSIIDVLVCDMQPLGNLKTLQKVKALGGESEVWAKEANEAGLKSESASSRRLRALQGKQLGGHVIAGHVDGAGCPSRREHIPRALAARAMCIAELAEGHTAPYSSLALTAHAQPETPADTSPRGSAQEVLWRQVRVRRQPDTGGCGHGAADVHMSSVSRREQPQRACFELVR